MAELTLVLVLHNHQPYGNFPAVFERASELAYGPMLEALERHPHLRFGLHYSGTLLDWLDLHRPELVERLAKLVDRGQVELLTGGYHEPILPVVPEWDRRGQIERMTERLHERFGVRPAGLWLAERIWEPGLPASLAASGVRYTLVDDAHFQLAGLTKDALLGHYVTEDLGAVIHLFASLKELRYRIPWSPVEEVIDWLRERAGAVEQALAVMGDDGEKLGLWPGTYAHVWRSGWWDRFCTALERESDWLCTATPSEALAASPPRGRVYLPAASYDEMGEWALPAEAGERLRAARLAAEERDDGSRPLLAGGIWRGFLAKYPEANTLHKKMLWVSGKVRRLPEGPEKAAAQSALWAGQSNCPYWHGVFGGLYLFHLRAANWAALLEAEEIADQVAHGQGPWSRLTRTDWDADGRDETVVETSYQNLILAPHAGGGLLAWDWRTPRVNALFALARRREAYHADLAAAVREGRVVLVQPESEEPDGGSVDEEAANGLIATDASGEAEAPASIHAKHVRVKELGLEQRLVVDPGPRLGFADRWLPAGATIDDLAGGAVADEAGLFDSTWSVASIQDADPERDITVRLTWRSAPGSPLGSARKTYRVARDAARLEVAYRLRAPQGAELAGRLAVEVTWGLAGGNADDAWMECQATRRPLTADCVWQQADGYRLGVPAAGVTMACTIEPAADLWEYPIEAVASSDGGFERSYQGTAVVTVWTVAIGPGKKWLGRMTLEWRYEGGGAHRWGGNGGRMMRWPWEEGKATRA